MRIAVAGATGVVGAYVVEEARRRGHDVVPLARSLGVDVAVGDGLDEALAGVDVVIDVLSTTEGGEKARAFYERTTTNLLRAEERVGVGHHLALSIVGIDGVPFGYYEAKVRQEELVEAGPVPWTILRATQFHEFAGQLLDRMGTRVVAPVPRMLSQPIAAVEVAAALVDRAESRPGWPRARARRPGEAPDGRADAEDGPCEGRRRAGAARARPRSLRSGHARRHPDTEDRRTSWHVDLRVVDGRVHGQLRSRRAEG